MALSSSQRTYVVAIVMALVVIVVGTAAIILASQDKGRPSRSTAASKNPSSGDSTSSSTAATPTAPSDATTPITTTTSPSATTPISATTLPSTSPAFSAPPVSSKSPAAPPPSPAKASIAMAWTLANQVIATDPLGDLAPLKAHVQSMYDQGLISIDADYEYGYSAEYFVQRALLKAVKQASSKLMQWHGKHITAGLDKNQATIDSLKHMWIAWKRQYEALLVKPNDESIRQLLEHATFDDFVRHYFGKKFEEELGLPGTRANNMQPAVFAKYHFVLSQLSGSPYVGSSADLLAANVVAKLENSCVRRRNLLLELTRQTVLNVYTLPANSMTPLAPKNLPSFSSIAESQCFSYPGVTGSTQREYYESLRAHLSDRIEEALGKGVCSAAVLIPPTKTPVLLQHLSTWRQAGWPAGKPMRDVFLARVLDEADPQKRVQLAKAYHCREQSAESIAAFGKHLSINEIVHNGRTAVESNIADPAIASAVKKASALNTMNDAKDVQIFMSTGELLQFRVDAIVCPTGQSLQANAAGGIEGAIHAAFGNAATTPAGKQTLQSLIDSKIQPTQCTPGDARALIVGGANLRDSVKDATTGMGSHASDYIKAIIFAVGPSASLSKPERSHLLRSAVRAVLREADGLGIRSVAIGGLGYVPEAESASIIMRTVQQWVADNPDTRLRLIFLHANTPDEVVAYAEKYRRIVLSLN